MSTRPSTPAQHWLSTLIVSEGRESGTTLPSIAEADPERLCDLVRTLCRGANPQVRPSKRRTRLANLQESIDFLAPLDAMLSDWPSAFELHVADRIAAGKEQARTLTSLLGHWYAQVKSAAQGNSLQPFLECVIKVAADEFDGVLSLDSAEHIAANLSGFVRASTAAATLGLSRDALVEAIQAGACEHRTRRFGTRGLVYEVPSSEIERIADRRRQWVGEADACATAGVTAAVLNLMAQAGVIDVDTRWKSDIEKGGPFRVESITELRARLASAVTGRGQSTQDCITWAEFTRRRMGDRQAIHSAMKAAAQGQLVPVSRGRELGQIGFLKADVKKYLGTSVPGGGMTIQQLADATGWKWESISHWINEGILNADQSFERGQPCRVVTTEYLLKFRQTYLPLADLARAMDTKSSSLAERLPGVEIFGAKPLPSGARRGGLVRISDLGRLAAVGVSATLFPFQV